MIISLGRREGAYLSVFRLDHVERSQVAGRFLERGRNSRQVHAMIMKEGKWIPEAPINRLRDHSLQA